MLMEAGVNSLAEQPVPDVVKRSASVPKHCSEQPKRIKRLSAPSTHACDLAAAAPTRCNRWGTLQQDLLMLVVSKVAPKTASNMRLVSTLTSSGAEIISQKLQKGMNAVQMRRPAVPVLPTELLISITQTLMQEVRMRISQQCVFQ